MSKIAVMGSYDSIYGFAAVGLETVPVTDPDEAKQRLRSMAEDDYAVIYMTEELAASIPREVDRYKEQKLPAIILIPGISGNTGEGVAKVKKSVEQAVGSDILFGGE